MEKTESALIVPEILAPAGDSDCFLAALAAGANGVYLGLKNFSARMEAKNFGLGELGRLVDLAHEHDCRVYVAMNNMLKQSELERAFRLARRLAEQVRPDGLIIQDLAMLEIAKQADFDGSLVFSTLANISDPTGLYEAKRLGADRVVLPRELSIDEIRAMGENCPDGLELECFAHGALCYCVSGRCYWSSYMGGKSGLRGRCVQPCRRIYGRQPKNPKAPAHPGRGERFFSCQDLELLPVARTLLSTPHLVSWKIEGRKKGPHYVYHAVTAYRMLRDYAGDSQKRKMAAEILEMSLGRPGTRARFLPQKKTMPMAPGRQTSSGLLAGKISIRQDGTCAIRPHLELLPKDYLRIGSEDEKWHSTLPVTRRVPKGAIFQLNLPKHKTPKAGVAVYLIDRREPEFEKILKIWRGKLDQLPEPHIYDVDEKLKLPAPSKGARRPDMFVSASPQQGKWSGGEKRGQRALRCIWLSTHSAGISRTLYDRTYFWLPPVVWPENDAAARKCLQRLWQGGARKFVCNAPWQRGFFPKNLPEDADLVAGPFCNLANSLALQKIAAMGFCAAFVSPELPSADLLSLPAASPLPLGIVTGGFWPVGVSRFGLAGLEAGEVFFSPKGEEFWSRDRGGLTWIFPAWPLDLSEKRRELTEAGYKFFAWLDEKAPTSLKVRARPGLFNWDGALL